MTSGSRSPRGSDRVPSGRATRTVLIALGVAVMATGLAVVILPLDPESNVHAKSSSRSGAPRTLPRPPAPRLFPSVEPPPSQLVRATSEGIACGDATCDSRSEHCCWGPGSFKCTPRGTGCPPDTVRFECNDSADCGGTRCCVTVTEVRCAAVCDPLPGQKFRQLCSEDTECGGGQCIEKRAGTVWFRTCD